uniref:Uncharacterized protein n=1 Tax=Oryza meridionalis TaxID=40149 RepID=A0A0E0DJQ7_9ORYZ
MTTGEFLCPRNRALLHSTLQCSCSSYLNEEKVMMTKGETIDLQAQRCRVYCCVRGRREPTIDGRLVGVRKGKQVKAMVRRRSGEARHDALAASLLDIKKNHDELCLNIRPSTSGLPGSECLHWPIAADGKGSRAATD